MSRYRNLLEDYLKTLDIKCNSCLDVGGSANPICNRVKSFDVKDYKILDNNNEKGSHGDRWKEPDYKTHIDMLDGNIANGLNGVFDVVFCLEVFEYLHPTAFRNAMRNLRGFLKKDGVLYLSTCWAYPIHNPVKSDCLRISREVIERYGKLTTGGLEILECIPRRFSPEAFAHLKQAWKIDGLHAARGYPDHDVCGYVWKLKKKIIV